MIFDKCISFHHKVFISVVSAGLWVYFRTSDCYAMIPRLHLFPVIFVMMWTYINYYEPLALPAWSFCMSTRKRRSIFKEHSDRMKVWKVKRAQKRLHVDLQVASCRHLDQHVDQHVGLSHVAPTCRSTCLRPTCRPLHRKIFFDKNDHIHNKIQILEGNLCKLNTIIIIKCYYTNLNHHHLHVDLHVDI